MRSVSLGELATVLAAIVVALAVARVEALILQDLARTRDEDLRYLTRKGWVVAIVAMIPLGAIMYLTYGKGPDRFA
jgi:hypothetical protein